MTTPDDSSNQRLPRPLDEQAWEASLSAALGARVEVRYGRATREVIQLRREPQRIRVRLSALMASAPPEIEAALAEWIRGRGRRGAAQRELDRWIDARLRESARAAPAKLALEAKGAHHDLGELREHLRTREFASDFEGSALPPIGWGRAGRSRSRRSLRLGSFDPFSYSVRVHPVLDSADAPRFFVRYIVFHELLHAALDQPPDEQGRRRVHGPAFRARERQYVDYERALAWEKEHIHALIASARAGRGLHLPQAKAKAQTREREPKDQRGWLQRLLF